MHQNGRFICFLIRFGLSSGTYPAAGYGSSAACRDVRIASFLLRVGPHIQDVPADHIALLIHCRIAVLVHDRSCGNSYFPVRSIKHAQSDVSGRFADLNITSVSRRVHSCRGIRVICKGAGVVRVGSADDHRISFRVGLRRSVFLQGERQFRNDHFLTIFACADLRADFIGMRHFIHQQIQDASACMQEDMVSADVCLSVRPHRADDAALQRIHPHVGQCVRLRCQPRIVGLDPSDMEIASLLNECDLTVIADVYTICSGGFSDHDFHRSRRHGNILRLFSLCSLPQRFHDPVCLILFHQRPVQFQVGFRAFAVISLSILCMEDARSVICDQRRSCSAAQDLCQDLFKLLSAEHICLRILLCSGAALIFIRRLARAVPVILLGLIRTGLIFSEGQFHPGIEGFHSRRCLFFSKDRVFHRLPEDKQELPAEYRAVR